VEWNVEKFCCCFAGRNENAQLAQGDTVRRDVPTLIDSLSGLNVVRVACGKAHTLFLTGTSCSVASIPSKSGIKIGRNFPPQFWAEVPPNF